MKTKLALIVCSVALALTGCSDNHEKIGSVDTRFRLLSPDDRIEVETFSDPNVKGVQCYISHAKTGGLKEVGGLEEDVSDASISCVKVVDKVEFNEEQVKKPRTVYKRSSSMVLKSQQVKAYYDEQRKTFTYLVYSDKILDGSPKNAVSTFSCLAGSYSEQNKAIGEKELVGTNYVQKQGDCIITSKIP